ncbi:MAG: ABC transporter substrate-binding protein [Clostridia bacterium]|nr:ABC transporter substrate-binding protein [Clostridia bacterium]
MKFSVRILLSFLLFTSFILVVGCTNEANQEQEKPIRIGLLQIDDSLPFFVAEEEGLFEKHNVQIQLIPFSAARDKDLALEAGELDGVLTDLIVTALIKKGGTDVRVVSLALGATPEEGRFAILTAPNSDIESLAELQDVPIAISNNTIIHYLAEKMFQNVDLDAKSIKTQSIPDLKIRLEALLEGKDVKLALLPDPLASLAEQYGAKAIIDDTKLNRNLSQSVIIFREDVLTSNREAVRNVLKAHQEGAQLINNNPEKYNSLLIEKARIPESLVETYPMPTFTPGSLPTEEMVEEVMTWMVEKDLLKEAFSYEDIVDEILREN